MTSRILIDGRAAIRSETGGVERWAKELCSRLPEMSSSRYSVASPPAAMAHRLGHAWEQFILPSTVTREGFSALLCPANLAPLRGRANIVILHDAAPLRFPHDYSRAYAQWQAFLLPRLVRSALRIITPSRFSRDELVDLCGADPDRISVVQPGVPDALGLDADVELSARVLGLDRPYVLTVASRVGRKNLGALERTGAELAGHGIELVAVGGGRPQLRGEDGTGHVRELGAVADDLLGGLYRGASAFVLPSRYEGFGLPVVEAMASGTPVVCSSASALPEAAGGAALLVDPNDGDAIATAVLSAVADPRLRSDLIARGRERTAGLTWHSTAEAVDRVCVDAVGDGRALEPQPAV